MKKATLQNIDVIASALKDSNSTDDKMHALVDVTMTPAENSVFDPNQTETSFYLILKQPLIDEFATWL